MSTPIVRRRKKAIEVDTIQWLGDNEADVQAFAGGAAFFFALDDEDRENSDDPEATAAVFDCLHSTWILVYTGQHIVRGVKRELYPIAEDVVVETYDVAPAAGRLSGTVREQLVHQLQCEGAFTAQAAVELADVYRAEVLAEAATVVGNDDDCDCGGCDTCVPRHLAARLLEMATEKSSPAGADATPGEAYEGELAMLRGLVRTLRAVVRDDRADVAQREVRRLLYEHTADERDAYAQATEAAAS